MNNYVGELVKAYYHCLNGNITYNGDNVNVYGIGVEESEKFHYIQLRPESEGDLSNKDVFVTSPVIILDINTVHEGSIDYGVVEDIDNQAKQLLFPTRRTNGLIITGDFQVTIIKHDNGNYLEGFDGTRHNYRKVLRFFNRINQMTIS